MTLTTEQLKYFTDKGYTQAEVTKFEQDYCSLIFVSSSGMNYDKSHVLAYNNRMNWALDIMTGKWNYYQSVKSDLDEAEKVYQLLQELDVEIISEENWEKYRGLIISSITKAAGHNLHAQSWGQEGKCIAADGRANWGKECLFPSDMLLVISQMGYEQIKVSKSDKIFRTLDKQLETLLSKLNSPAFRYDRTKKQLLEQKKREEQIAFAEAEATKKKSEEAQLERKMLVAMEELRKNPHGEEAKKHQQEIALCQQQRSVIEQELQDLGIMISGLEKQSFANKEQREKERPANWKDFMNNVQEEANNDDDSSTSSLLTDDDFSETTFSPSTTPAFYQKPLFWIMGVIFLIIIGGIVFIKDAFFSIVN